MADPSCAATTAPSIPVFLARIGHVEQPCVDARTLHTLLEAGNSFCHWFNARVQKYRLQAGRDYAPTAEPACDAQGLRIGRPPKNYHFGIETAKALSLAEGTAAAQGIWRQLIGQEPDVVQSPADTGNDYARISTTQAQTLRELVTQRVHRTSLHYQTVWTAFQHRFGINSYQHLPASRFDEACAYLRDTSLIAAPGPHQQPTAPWATEVQHAINRRAWALAADTLPLFQQFLERYVSEHTNGRYSANEVAALLQPLQPDDCLSPRYTDKLRQASDIVCDTQRSTNELFERMQAQLKALVS